MDPIESVEYDGCEMSDNGWTKVVNRKQRQKQNQQAKILLENESKVARYKNLKAEEIKKTKPNKTEKMPKEVSLPQAAAKIESEIEKQKEVPLPEAAAKIDASHLAATLADSQAPSLSKTSEVPMDPIKSAEHDGCETSDHGWTKVENRKQRRKQEQLAKIESKVGRYKNLKAKEINKMPKVCEKPKPEQRWNH